MDSIGSKDDSDRNVVGGRAQGREESYRTKVTILADIFIFAPRMRAASGFTCEHLVRSRLRVGPRRIFSVGRQNEVGHRQSTEE